MPRTPPRGPHRAAGIHAAGPLWASQADGQEASAQAEEARILSGTPIWNPSVPTRGLTGLTDLLMFPRQPYNLVAQNSTKYRNYIQTFSVKSQALNTNRS